MLDPKSTPFGIREEPIRDPEQLNRAIHLTARSTWLLLGVLTLCVLTIVAWSFLGRLSFYVQGMGVILMQRGVVFDIVSTSAGSVQEIRVSVGQQVKKNDVLFIVKQDELTARRKMARDALAQQQDALAKYQASSQADVQRRRDNLDQQLKSLQNNLADAQNNQKQLTDIYAGQQQELARGYTTKPQVQAAYDRLSAVQQYIRTMTDQLSSLQTQQIEFEDQVNRAVADLEMKVTAAKGNVDDLDVQISFGGTIRSPSDGVVTEIATQVNAIIPAASQLAVVETGGESLVVHAYLPISGGKRVAVGMPAEISPTSVERDIYGSLRGQVTSVSALPVTRQGLMNIIGDDDLVSQLMASGAPIEVQMTFESDPTTRSGLRWTSSSGPPLQITPGTTAESMILVQRQRPISLVVPLAQTWLSL